MNHAKYWLPILLSLFVVVACGQTTGVDAATATAILPRRLPLFRLPPLPPSPTILACG